MLKLKLQYFSHLMRRTDSFEKTLILGKIEGGKRRGWQRMGDTKRNPLTEFNSNNTTLLTVEETKAKIASLKYIQDELAKMEQGK